LRAASEVNKGMNEITEMSFEEAFAELEATVERLERGDLSLEESIALFERGQALAARCNVQLDTAELKVRQLLPDGDGEAAPFDVG
jgi:exodeoxyribonuclease VII small subunit